MAVLVVKIVTHVMFADLNFSMIRNHPNVLNIVEMVKSSTQLVTMVTTKMEMDALEIAK